MVIQWRHIFPLTRTYVRLILRDKSALFWFMFFPMIFVLLFGTVIPSVGSQDQMIVVAPSHLQLDDQLVQSLRGIPAVSFDDSATIEDSIEQFEAGMLSGLIVFDSEDHLRILYQESAQSWALMLKKMLEADYPAVAVSLELNPDIPKFTTMDFILTGMIPLTIMQIGLFGGTSLLVERSQRILRRFKTNNIKASEIIISNILSRIMLQISAAAILILFGKLVLGFHAVLGAMNILLLLALYLVGGFCFLSMGLLLASLSKTVESGNIMAQSLNFPMAFLCGAFVPMANLPHFIQFIAKVLPLTPLIEATRSIILLSNWSASSFLLDLGILAAWGVGALIIGSKLFKWE